jgi:uncharacterized protein (DUF983 family)
MLEKMCPVCGGSIKFNRYIKREFICDKCGAELKLVSGFLFGHIFGGITGVLFLSLLGLMYPPLVTSDGIIFAVFIIAVYMLVIFPIVFMKVTRR